MPGCLSTLNDEAPPGNCLLYLVRHGQTAGNGRRYVGWEDLPLDDDGRIQAQHAARLLAAIRLDGLHSSPLERARATAAAISHAQPGGSVMTVQEDDALKEIHYGELQGLDKRERPVRLRHEYLDVRMPAGESLADVHARATAFLMRNAALWQACSSVAVVGHFWSLRMLLGALRGHDLRQALAGRDYRPENGSVWRLPVTRSDRPFACGPLNQLHVQAGQRRLPPSLHAEACPS